jgi:hypothetical protein
LTKLEQNAFGVRPSRRVGVELRARLLDRALYVVVHLVLVLLLMRHRPALLDCVRARVPPWIACARAEEEEEEKRRLVLV